MNRLRLAGNGHHRRNHDAGPVTFANPDWVHAEPAFGDLTIDELRRFCDEAEEATGPGLSGHLRPRVAVRFSGAVRSIRVKIPRD